MAGKTNEEVNELIDGSAEKDGSLLGKIKI
jgi:hypothetical protein